MDTTHTGIECGTGQLLSVANQLCYDGWVELGRVDIITRNVVAASRTAMPREGHLDAMLQNVCMNVTTREWF
jgi:hypothetical protein